MYAQSLTESPTTTLSSAMERLFSYAPCNVPVEPGVVSSKIFDWIYSCKMMIRLVILPRICRGTEGWKRFWLGD